VKKGLNFVEDIFLFKIYFYNTIWQNYGFKHLQKEGI